MLDLKDRKSSLSEKNRPQYDVKSPQSVTQELVLLISNYNALWELINVKTNNYQI